jgi:hypothetical protein
MRRVVATAVAAALLAAPVASAAQPPPPRVGQLKDLSVPDLFPHGCDALTFPRADFETHVAVNTRRPRKMVAAWIEGTGVTIVTAATHDGGRTWHESKVPGLHCTGDTGAVLSGDPWLAYGPGRRVYLVLGTEARGGGGGDPSGSVRYAKVLASHSSDNGDTWSKPKVVADASDFNDKYAVTTDPRRKGHAWIVWTKGRPPTFSMGDLYLSETRNAGETWSQPHRILANTGALYPWGATVRPLPNGDLLCAVMLWNPAGLTQVPLPSRPDFQAVAIRSRDGGRTWSAPVKIADVPVGRIRDPDGGNGSVVRANQGVSLVTAADGTAFAVWWQRGADGAGEVVLSRSRDGGRHWSTPKTVTGATRSAFLPAVATGRRHTVGITYYDLRHDHPGDRRLTTDAWFALSRDQGAHWRTVHMAGPFNMRSAAVVDNQLFIGDYFGLAATPKGFAAVPALARPISRDGRSDVFYAPITVNARRSPRAALNVR